MYKGSDTTVRVHPPFSLSLFLPPSVANTATLGRVYATLRLLHAHEYVAGFSSNAISAPASPRPTVLLDPSTLLPARDILEPKGTSVAPVVP